MRATETPASIVFVEIMHLYVSPVPGTSPGLFLTDDMLVLTESKRAFRRRFFAFKEPISYEFCDLLALSSRYFLHGSS